MTVCQDVRAAEPTVAQPFDLDPDEDQRLVLDMVERFAARHLGGSDPAGAQTARAFAQLGLDEILADFSDPVLIAMICQRLGAQCAMTGLRLVLPHLMPVAGQAGGSANFAVAVNAGGRTGITGLVFDPESPLSVLSGYSSVCSVQLEDYAELEYAHQAMEQRGCRVICGNVDSGRLRNADAPVIEAPESAGRLALVLTALLLGGIGRALDFGFDYAKDREAFGRSIIGHQPVAFRLVDGVLKFDALRLLMLNEATMFPLGRGVKGLAEETISASSAVLRDVMQNCGGHGYVAGIEINTLFQTNSLCRAILSSVSQAFLTYPNPETGKC